VSLKQELGADIPPLFCFLKTAVTQMKHICFTTVTFNTVHQPKKGEADI
jgi:hypothetical protein